MKLMLWLWVAGLSLRMVLGLITEENGVERKFVHYLLGFGPPSAEDRLTYSYKGEVSYLGGDPCLGVPKDADVKGKFVLFDIALGFRKCPVEMALSVQERKGIGMLWTVQEDSSVWGFQRIHPEQAKKVRIPSALTAHEFTDYIRSLNESQRVNVILNATGDGILERSRTFVIKGTEIDFLGKLPRADEYKLACLFSGLDRLLTPLFSLAWSAMVGATLATGFILVANLCGLVYAKVRDWVMARWRLQRITRIPFKHYNPVSSAEEEVCTICLESFKRGDRVNVFPCKHIYHRDCIVSWLERSQLCPVCKRDVFDDSLVVPTTSSHTSTTNRPVEVDGNGDVESQENEALSPSHEPRGPGRHQRERDYVAVQIECPSDETQN